MPFCRSNNDDGAARLVCWPKQRDGCNCRNQRPRQLADPCDPLTSRVPHVLSVNVVNVYDANANCFPRLFRNSVKERNGHVKDDAVRTTLLS